MRLWKVWKMLRLMKMSIISFRWRACSRTGFSIMLRMSSLNEPYLPLRTVLSLCSAAFCIRWTNSTTDALTRWLTSWATRWNTILTVTPPSVTLLFSWLKRTCWWTRRVTSETFSRVMMLPPRVTSRHASQNLPKRSSSTIRPPTGHALTTTVMQNRSLYQWSFLCCWHKAQKALP